MAGQGKARPSGDALHPKGRVAVVEGQFLSGLLVSAPHYYGADRRAASVVVAVGPERAHNVVVTAAESLALLPVLEPGARVAVRGTLLDWGQGCGAEYWGTISRCTLGQES